MTYRIAHRAVLGLITVLVTAAMVPGAAAVDSHSASNDGQTYTVSGTVNDSFTQLPIDGVHVSTNLGPSTTTNSQGAFTLTVPSTSSVTVSATARGYHRDSLNVTLGQDVVGVVLTLRPFVFLTEGALVNVQNWSPISGALVSVTPGLESTRSSAQGQFALNVPNGTFELSVAAAGYLPVHEALSMNGTPMTKYLLLTPSNATPPTSGASPGGGSGSFFSTLVGMSESAAGIGAVLVIAAAAIGAVILNAHYRRSRVRRLRAYDSKALLFTMPARSAELEKGEGADQPENMERRTLRRRYRAFWRKLF